MKSSEGEKTINSCPRAKHFSFWDIRKDFFSTSLPPIYSDYVYLRGQKWRSLKAGDQVLLSYF